MSEYFFTTSRLGFRAWREADREPFSIMNADPSVMEFFPNVLTPSESDSLVRKIEKNFEVYGYGLWAVELLKTKEFIGFIGLSHPTFQADFTPCVEVGWRLAFEFWDQGYATEGAKACLKYGFTNLNLPEIVSFTSALNVRSINVMKKIGMCEAGDFFHPTVNPNSSLSKHVFYKISKTKKDLSIDLYGNK